VGKLIIFTTLLGLVLIGCSSQASQSPSATVETLPSQGIDPQPDISNPIEAEVTATEKLEEAGMTSAQSGLVVTITGANEFPLIGSYYAPFRLPAPAVLLLHMYGQSRAAWQPFADRLQESGFAVLALDLRGHGDSGGAEDWVLAREDVRLAYLWLSEQQGIDTQRTGVVGASIGANLSLWLGANEPQIEMIALLSPGFDYFRVTIEGLMEQYAPRASFMAASEDDGYSADTVRELQLNAVESAEVVIFEEAGHGMHMFNAEPTFEDTLFAFVSSQLGP
jgi:dienelactone hydrolase